eukprot:4731375-Pyramimonas_sp.AAC.1
MLLCAQSLLPALFGTATWPRGLPRNHQNNCWFAVHIVGKHRENMVPLSGGREICPDASPRRPPKRANDGRMP